MKSYQICLCGIFFVHTCAVFAQAVSQAQLDAQCEAARNALLAPQRQRFIEQCIAEKQRDRAGCERFYRDYGYAGSQGGRYVTRMYDDIPECVAAREKKEAGSQTRKSNTTTYRRDSSTGVRNRDSDDNINRDR